jgi:hypothetical protein
MRSVRSGNPKLTFKMHFRLRVRYMDLPSARLNYAGRERGGRGGGLGDYHRIKNVFSTRQKHTSILCSGPNSHAAARPLDHTSPLRHLLTRAARPTLPVQGVAFRYQAKGTRTVVVKHVLKPNAIDRYHELLNPPVVFGVRLPTALICAIHSHPSLNGTSLCPNFLVIPRCFGIPPRTPSNRRPSRGLTEIPTSRGHIYHPLALFSFCPPWVDIDTMEKDHGRE